MGIMQRPRFPRGPRPRGMRRILAVSRPRRRSLANLGAEEIRQNRDVVVAGGIRCGPTTSRPIGGMCSGSRLPSRPGPSRVPFRVRGWTARFRVAADNGLLLPGEPIKSGHAAAFWDGTGDHL